MLAHTLEPLPCKICFKFPPTAIVESKYFHPQISLKYFPPQMIVLLYLHGSGCFRAHICSSGSCGEQL